MSTRRETKIIHKILDGEASKHETRILQEKLRQDPVVKQEFEGLKKIEEISREIGAPVQAPADFTERVLRGIRRDLGSRA